MSDNWQAARARNHFSEIIEAAIAGRPQFIRRRDGHEVVLVSRDYFDRTKPNLKAYLLGAGYAEEQSDAFDAALREAREKGPTLAPRVVRLKE
jgi:PHD/YefM family antitoxin component YafN of YafNO toxin-antitoxin module